MAIFEVTQNELKGLIESSFSAEGLKERNDIQRLLRRQISVLGDNLMVVSEEYSNWIDSTRRIDLLCLDSEANLVVVELKRTEDGGHMELQALRYAAMVSAMTFEQLVDTFAKYKSKAEPNKAVAQDEIMGFLGWSSVDENSFNRDTRIILAAADFSRELTTTAMWLLDRDIDIRCIRMKLYRMADQRMLLDVQQLIPLPEAADFQTQIGMKKQAERQSRSERHDQRLKFWEALLNHARTRTTLHANRTPTKDNWLSGSIGRAGFALTYVVRESECQVELWIGMGSGQTAKNKAAFKALEAQKDLIEVEFGRELDWQELPEREGCRIRYVISDGGYRSPADDWAAVQEKLVEAMVNLDRVMRVRVAALRAVADT